MQRRRLLNLIVDSRALARTSIPFMALAAVSIGVILTVQNQVIRGLTQITLFGVENLATMNELLALQKTVLSTGLWGIIIFSMACLGLWIFFSHRIFGPTVPMRRHIRSLINGQYDSRIHSRTGDEFKEVIDDLNELAQVLEKSKK